MGQVRRPPMGASFEDRQEKVTMIGSPDEQFPYLPRGQGTRVKRGCGEWARNARNFVLKEVGDLLTWHTGGEFPILRILLDPILSKTIINF